MSNQYFCKSIKRWRSETFNKISKGPINPECINGLGWYTTGVRVKDHDREPITDNRTVGKRFSNSHLGFQHSKSHCLFGIHTQQQVGHTRNGHSSFLRDREKTRQVGKVSQCHVFEFTDYQYLFARIEFVLLQTVQISSLIINPRTSALLTIQSMSMNLSLSSLKAWWPFLSYAAQMLLAMAAVTRASVSP